MQDKLVNLIYKVAEETNPDLAKHSQTNGANTRLFGRGGLLDSLGLVRLIVAIEGALEEELGVSVVLADERAMSQKNSPFRTIESLTNYIVLLLEEK